MLFARIYKRLPFRDPVAANRFGFMMLGKACDQRPALRDLAPQLALRERVDGVAGEVAGRLACRIGHGGNARLRRSLGARWSFERRA